MGFFKNLGQRIGNHANKFLAGSARMGGNAYGLARRASNAVTSAANRGASFLKKVDEATGGLAGDVVAGFVPGGAAALSIGSRALNALNRVNTAINQGEGQVRAAQSGARMLGKRIRSGASNIGSAIDTTVGQFGSEIRAGVPDVATGIERAMKRGRMGNGMMMSR